MQIAALFVYIVFISALAWWLYALRYDELIGSIRPIDRYPVNG